MFHPYVTPFVERAKAVPVRSDGKRYLTMVAHDLAKARNALSRGESEDLATFANSDDGDSYFEAVLADGSTVRVNRVGLETQQLVRELGAFEASDLRLFAFRPALIGTSEGIARQRREENLDELLYAVRFEAIDRVIGGAVYAELTAAGATVAPVGERPY